MCWAPRGPLAVSDSLAGPVDGIRGIGTIGRGWGGEEDASSNHSVTAVLARPFDVRASCKLAFRLRFILLRSDAVGRLRSLVHEIAANVCFMFFYGSGKMPQGTIKKLTDKGFGFIEGERGDIFFHHSSVEGASYESLREGQLVEYEEGRGPKGPRAENVKIV